MGHIAFIGIGSNMGDKVRRCEEAISEILKVDRHTLLAKSSFFKTQPMGYTLQDWFVNGVIKIETELEALDLLHSLKTIERQMGRVKTFRWGPRAIDLDILLFDGTNIEIPELQIPHPRLHERQFVLVPLAEIDPNLLHPVLKKTVQGLLEDLKENQGVERLLDDR
ncbi:MAG: 2-amino-4-hydroxy-6-hydroxymethyldihydropteridine diphosphokinase [Deltaproteobacteria bacterium RBG_13_52_11b]|nr:MAG: 2-amino-4-hydroxy-6-hydroxymethyldihydropteridine diphosphokinase [Deltaproteobacteria bacterium RBG_13_52_11b]